MKRKELTNGIVCASLVLVAILAQNVNADVGEIRGALPGGLRGSISVRVTQGGSDVINAASVPLPTHIKFNNGTALDYVVLDTWDAGLATETDIILKVISDGGLVESRRDVHFYIDSITPGQLHIPGPISLFNPANAGLIDVEISNFRFFNTLTAEPILLNMPYYSVSFMRNDAGHFYNFPEANGYDPDGPGGIPPHLWNVQIPGTEYLTNDPTKYTFSSTSGGVVSWTWENLVNPQTGTGLVKADGTPVNPPTNGFVHELGMALSFTGIIPEPTTLSLMMLSPLVFRRRRRQQK